MHVINESVLDGKEVGRTFKVKKTACAKAQSTMFENVRSELGKTKGRYGQKDNTGPDHRTL